MNTGVTAHDMVRSEEGLVVNRHEQPTGRVRLVKHVVTKDVNVTVPLRHEEVVDVQKHVVVKERVCFAKDVVKEHRTVFEEVRSEEVEVERDPRVK